ncbi:hypothetical protein [Mucilaginibacter sp.]
MQLNKKFMVTAALMAGMTFIGLTSMQQSQPHEEMKAVNLKVLPKNLTHEQLEGIADEWALVRRAL